MTPEFSQESDLLNFVSSSCRKELVPGSAVICMDDRFLFQFGDIHEEIKDRLIVSEAQTGPQIPGGSAGFIVVMAETAPEDVPLEIDMIYEVVAQAHKNSGYKMGVHIDNNHGKLTEQDLGPLILNTMRNLNNTNLSGCGFAAMITSSDNKLGLSLRSQEFFNKINLIAYMVYAGANLAVYDGNHASIQNGALALSNMKPNTSLNREALEEKGIQIYGHDPLVAKEIIDNMANELDNLNYPNWADNLRKYGGNKELKYHEIAAKALTGRNPVVID